MTQAVPKTTETMSNFVTVVSVGARAKQEINENINFDSSSSDYVTVLTIGEDENKKNIKDVTEEVIVYRLPGERLGFGLKFEGGTKANEFVKRLFIQSCAANSPASRVKSSWGKLTEGDEVLEIDSVAVNTMTRIDCVRCLKESNVAIKLLVRHTYEYEAKNKIIIPPLVISAEEKRVPPPPPPVPPRKISRKLLKNINNTNSKEPTDNVDSRAVVESNKQKKLQSPRGSIRSYNSPDVSRRDRRFSDGSLGPPDAEVCVDLFLQESTQSLSESDETGSTISTVIDRFGSFPTTTTSSFSGSLPSTPTAVQRELDISNVNIYDEEDNKGLGKPTSLPREENNNIILDYINPLCFQDSPLSYGNESTKNIIPDEIDSIKEETVVADEVTPVLKKPQVPPRSRDNHLTSEKNEVNKMILENLPRLVDFVPKSVNGNGIKEIENPEEAMDMFLDNDMYKADFDYYERENDNVDNFSNGVDLYSSKWSLSSQLATIGEVEEEGSSEFNFNRPALKSTPVVIVENTDKNEETEKPEDEDPELKTEETNGIMATLPSDSRQPPDGHEFPDFIEIHSESSNENYYSEKELHITAFNADFSKPDFSKQNDLINSQSVSTSNTDLRPKMYESTEDLKFNEFISESNLLHTRSQSLIDVSALNKQKYTKWNQMFEQRRKGLSKLKGLVIPEAVESDFSSNVNIPEIKSQTTPVAAAVYLPVPKLDTSFHAAEELSSSHTDLIKSSVVMPTWSSNSSSNVPKYSPAFRRKSLQVYPTSINKSENSDYTNNVDYIKYCDKSSPKGSKINDDDLNPPKSLESISSPTRSDCSFDYISSTKKRNKSSTDFYQKFTSAKGEDESDNDSAMSSSQSSYNSRYSPPSSPTRSCELNHYYKKPDEDNKSSKNRLLKPSSVEAINRKNILASAKCRSGKDLKIGSPVIRRKQEETQVTEIQQNGNGVKEELIIRETIANETHPKVSDTLERTTQVGSSNEEKPKKLLTLKLVKPSKEVPHTANTTPSPKVILKSISPIITDNKPIYLFNNNSKSKKPVPINVKALKQSFENLTSSLPVPQKVPVFKPTVKRCSKIDNAILETKVSAVNNGTVQEFIVDKVQIPTTHKARSDVEKKTVVLKTDSNGTSLGISIFGGVDENKEITINRIRYASIAYSDGRLKKGDKIISINGIPTRGMTHQEAVDLLKEPDDKITMVIEEGNDVPSPTSSSNSLSKRPSSMTYTKSSSSPKEETKKANNIITIMKDGAGLGFSIEGGKDSPKGDVPLLVKKIFTGGAAEKSGVLKVGDQIIQINDIIFTSLTRIEAWNAMKKIADGKVDIYVYR